MREHLLLIKNLNILAMTGRYHLDPPFIRLTLLSVIVSRRLIIFVDKLSTLINIILNTSFINNAASWLQNRLRFRINALLI